MKNKKLLVSAMALGLAGLTTVGSTYAWFTANGTVDVNGINVQVSTADSSIFVAAAAHSETTPSLKYAPEVDLTSLFTVTGGLKPVTTDDAVEFYSLDQTNEMTAGSGHKYGISFTSNVATGFYYGAAQDVADSVTAKQLIAVDLYIATSKDATVYLQLAPTWSNPTNKETGEADARNVARWSFAIDGGAPVIYKLGDFDTRSENDLAKQAYLSAFLTRPTESEAPSFNKGHGTDDDDLDVIATGAVLSGEQNVSYRVDSTFDAADYDFHKITIQFWFEGNDYDCRNSISEQSFGTTFVLTTSDPN